MRHRETRETRATARKNKKEPLPLSETRVVMFLSRAFRSTDKENRETARSLDEYLIFADYSITAQQTEGQQHYEFVELITINCRF